MAFAAAVVAQGGYYPPGRILSTGLIVVAAAIALRTRPWSGADPMVALLACGGLAGWAVVRAALAGDVTAAGPTAAGVVCLAGAVLVARRTDTAQRELCVTVAVGIGVLIAVTGWIAVVARIPSWTTVADGLFRASSTLTYPNATAALLAALAVLSIALQAIRPDSLSRAGATYVLLVGLGATLSRAGVLAILAGLVLLSVLAGVSTIVRYVAPAALGAAVAFGALAPSFSSAQPARPVIAVLGFLAGLGIAVGMTRLRGRTQAALLLAAFAVTTIFVAVNASRIASTLFPGRIGLTSPDRAGATTAALDMVVARPIAGTGPGNTVLSFVRPDGQLRVIRYVHNEYLQILVQLGVIGLAFVVLFLVAATAFVRGGQRNELWAAAVAAVAVVLVHSAFDFLWHIPAVLLAAGLCIGLAGPPVETKENM